MRQSPRLFPPDPEFVILVDEHDRPVGTSEKLKAHLEGLRHRAFSIFLVDRSGRILLQQRHPAKYHSGGLWANSCCGHPRPSEDTEEAAQRRLTEELGISEPLEHAFTARYSLPVSDNMLEIEFAHVYFGLLREAPNPSPSEIQSVMYLSASDLRGRAASLQIAPWLNHYLTHHFADIENGVRQCTDRTM